MSDLIIQICLGSSIVYILELYCYFDDHRGVSGISVKKAQLKILSRSFSKYCNFDENKQIINGHTCGKESGA